MIQRIQSLYLALIVILSLLLLRGGILDFTNDSGAALQLSPSGIISSNNHEIIARMDASWTLTALPSLAGLLSLVSIFMFRVRKMQLWLTVLIIIISALLVAAAIWFGFGVVNKFKMIFSPGLKMIYPFLILLLSILAYRGIQKDERLVKSYDRLR